MNVKKNNKFQKEWHRATKPLKKKKSVSAHSAGPYTAALLVMVNVMKGGGRAPPTLTSLG
jgi:hypothetical protein